MALAHVGLADTNPRQAVGDTVTTRGSLAIRATGADEFGALILATEATSHA